MTGNEVMPLGLDPEEALALRIARSQAERGEKSGPHTVMTLVIALERLTQSAGREHRYWLTEKAEMALAGGAS